MYYKTKNGTITAEGKWDEKTCVRRQGGFDLSKTNLPSGMTYLPKGAVLAVDANGYAVLVKTAKAYEAAEKSATTLKVHKGHALKVGDVVAGATINAIAEGADCDTLTTTALGAAVKINDVVADANGAKAVGLNYANVKIDECPSVTITVQAYEIEEDTLPYPVNEAIKTALTARHAFKL